LHTAETLAENKDVFFLFFVSFYFQPQPEQAATRETEMERNENDFWKIQAVY